VGGGVGCPREGADGGSERDTVDGALGGHDDARAGKTLVCEFFLCELWSGEVEDDSQELDTIQTENNCQITKYDAIIFNNFLTQKYIVMVQYQQNTM